MSEKEVESLLKVRTSRRIYIPIYIMILILLGTAGYIEFSGKNLNTTIFGAVVAFSVIAIISTEFHRYSHLYELNNIAIMHTKGIFFKVKKRTDLLVVSDIEMEQSPWQMLLGIGNVDVMVFSKDSSTCMKNIDHPLMVTELVEKKMNEKKLGTYNPAKEKE